MQFKNRLEYIDHCVAGDITSFNTLLSKSVFDTFDRSYEIYRDYTKRKQSIKKVLCQVDGDNLIVRLKSSEKMADIISENIPKRGISLSQTTDGVELHMQLIDVANINYKEGDNMS